MSKQLATVRVNALEQALRTVIEDLRVPRDLRSALAVYRNQRTQLNSREKGPGPHRPISRLEAVQPVNACLSQDAERAINQDRSILSSVCSTKAEGLAIFMTLNPDWRDWSVEINGKRHNHVKTEVMEALIECAVLVCEEAAKEAPSRRPQ